MNYHYHSFLSPEVGSSTSRKYLTQSARISLFFLSRWNWVIFSFLYITAWNGENGNLWVTSIDFSWRSVVKDNWFELINDSADINIKYRSVGRGLRWCFALGGCYIVLATPWWLTGATNWYIGLAYACIIHKSHFVHAAWEICFIIHRRILMIKN